MKKAQNLLEFILIVTLVAVAGGVFVSKFDFNKIKSQVFMRPASSSGIRLEPMTDVVE